MNFFDWFCRKDLASHLDQTKEIKVSGIYFKIKKLSVLDHIHGAKVLTENYHVWAKESPEAIKVAEEKIKTHYRDIFLSCVVDPVLKRKESEVGPGEIWVDRLFLDFDLANNLYMQIMFHTHGKKKVKMSLSPSR